MRSLTVMVWSVRRHDAQWDGHAAGDDAHGEWDGYAGRHGHGHPWHDGLAGIHAHAAPWMTHPLHLYMCKLAEQ